MLEEEEQEQEQEQEQYQDQGIEAEPGADSEALQEPSLLLRGYKTPKTLPGFDTINPDSPEGSDVESLNSDKSDDLDFISESEDNELEEQAIIQNSQLINTSISPPDSDVESDEEDLQKIEQDQVLNYINRYHSECLVSNSDEIEALSKTSRVNNIIVDANHKTNPILSKYEKTKILGQRTKQLNTGCVPYIVVPSDIIDNYLIAQMELKAKVIPVIIRRPVSNNHSEYWKLQDLEQIY